MKGVFFDLGGTLFSYRKVASTTVPLLLEAVERLGLTREHAAIKDAYAGATHETTARYAEKSYYLHRAFFHDTFKRFTELLGAAANEHVETWYHDAHRDAMIGCLVLKEDCLDTLAHLKARGLYLSVVSNIDDDMLMPLIEREGLDRYLHHWTSSETAQSCKPDRRFFEVSLELSGLVAEDVLFVGDSPEHDIIGANAVGMRTALIVDGGMAPPLQTGRGGVNPDHRIESLSELRALLP